MTNRDKEIRSYVICGIMLFAFIVNSIHPMLSNEYTRQKEFETRQTWILDKNGHNINN
jgi:hypothetical protein